ncbi:phosphoenolpyruvate synthase [Echinicola marina]|uniref:phosphoenolpyruvate synthase n=1 Tax=Echinicola marina TaxID=2859768 RepID=UPI001CF66272|nr:phosphoenolpyruvate synthase [Echinicola marina]UCS92117.1 phosphoenolpyruvate synthase [Echinicola marina]
MSAPPNSYCIHFKDISNKDIQKVGGKNASLGEMTQKLQPLGIHIPEGFAITADAYWEFIHFNQLLAPLNEQLQKLDLEQLSNLAEIGSQCRKIIAAGHFPQEISSTIHLAFNQLNHKGLSFAVRSSATAEDLPTASFAGQHDSFLHITDFQKLIAAIQACYVSLFNDHAIKYRIDHGFDHMKVALSVGVQKMVRSDLSAAGVAFTLEPETGFDQIVYITAAYGLGENIVQGAVNPDEFYLFKPFLAQNKAKLLFKKLGLKQNKMVYAEEGPKPIKNIPCTDIERNNYSLTDTEVKKLAMDCHQIEQHYGMPMDIEWAKDGNTGTIYIVQARPETIHSQKDKDQLHEIEYQIKAKPKPLCSGTAVGRAIISGRVCLVNSLADEAKVQQGDIIVADITSPDWNSLLRKAVSIVTNKGGRTSHASIVARELGIHAVVGTQNATEILKDGQIITVSCVEGETGHIYNGKISWEEKALTIPRQLSTNTEAKFILANPFQAFRLANYPNLGVGLLRMEFIIADVIGIHPMALARYDQLPAGPEKTAIERKTALFKDKKHYFTTNLSQHLALVAAAFYPKEVIVRMSDFKSNEYAQLLGGSTFEPLEENPMLGFRGASKYYHENYKAGFALECEAIRILRDEMDMTNIKIMIPFCRTPEEGKKVLNTMKEFGLERGKNGLEIYVMAELPCNAVLAEDFADLFDGFSIGSNDLTQLVLGVDRDSTIIHHLFDERNPAVKKMISQLIQTAHAKGIKVGLCGQAPSDYPAFTQFLVTEGIDSISFNADALLTGIENISKAEKLLSKPSLNRPPLLKR